MSDRKRKPLLGRIRNAAWRLQNNGRTPISFSCSCSGAISTVWALKWGRDLPPGLMDTNTSQGFLTVVLDALCCHQMVMHSRLWKYTNKWQIKGLWTFFLWLSIFVGKQITVHFIFTFKDPSQSLSNSRTIDPCWIHAPQFWASSKDPEGKHWWNLRWD